MQPRRGTSASAILSGAGVETDPITRSRAPMIVTPKGGAKLTHPPHWLIDKVESDGNRIEVFWKPARPGNSTAFELSGNKRDLVQQPQSEGDKGPRRVFHRC